MFGTRIIAAALAALTVVTGLAGCKTTTKPQACNPPVAAAPATPIIHNVAYTAPAPTDTLYVNACGVDTSANKFDLATLPIRIDYKISGLDPHETPQLQTGLLLLNNQSVYATTTYTHPINYPIDLPFHLTVTVTYTGKHTIDIGKKIECWTETGRNTIHYERTAIQTATITRNNYQLTAGAGSARVICEYINPPE